MSAYWLARAKVVDPVQYKRYTDLVPPIIAKYQGRILARGGRHETLEGSDQFHRFVVIEFPSLELAVACHRSQAYQDAAAFRLAGAGINELTIVEGL